MRWPFKSKLSTDIRVFRDPKTDKITLRIVGPVGLPAENPMVTLSVTMDYALEDDAVERLSEQLAHFAGLVG
jgi:hypothetical protein